VQHRNYKRINEIHRPEYNSPNATNQCHTQAENTQYYTQLGKQISFSKKQLIQGANRIYQNADNLAKGIYFIKINGAGINFQEKVIKN
jgi:hypothetical protein